MNLENQIQKIANIIYKVASDNVEIEFDFTHYAYQYDHLNYLFPKWIAYYNLKYLICKCISPKSILEIGVRYGYSAISFLTASPKAKYLGIDNNSEVSGGERDALYFAKDILKDYDATILLGDSQKMDRFPGGIYDIIHVDGQQDGDGTFRDLELSIKQGGWIWVDGYFWTKENLLATTYFLDKYKDFIDFSISIPGYAGEMLIHINNKVHGLLGIKDNSYRAIVSEYGKDYYLNDCGGYEEFIRSNGQSVDHRLMSVAMLAGDIRDKNVLDIGCGRGELTYEFYKSGVKSVIGVDYSKDAINIANTFYKDYIGDRLKYVCVDILEMDIETKFDCVVMADVVEHIEENMFIALLKKISGLLAPDGYIVIHTAPNKLYYNYNYNYKVKMIRSLGTYIPKNPRTYYESIMHINEQTPDQLQKTLSEIFSNINVWTSGENHNFMYWCNRECDFPTLCANNSIYAVAGNSGSFEEVLLSLTEYNLNPEDIDLMIEAYQKNIIISTEDIGNVLSLDIKIQNKGKKTIYKFLSNSINMSYHIFEEIEQSQDELILHDGIRTGLSKNIFPGEISTEKIQIKMDPILQKNKKYKIMITLVYEGVFWFDSVNPKSVALIDLELH